MMRYTVDGCAHMLYVVVHVISGHGGNVGGSLLQEWVPDALNSVLILIATA